MANREQAPFFSAGLAVLAAVLTAVSSCWRWHPCAGASAGAACRAAESGTYYSDLMQSGQGAAELAVLAASWVAMGAALAGLALHFDSRAGRWAGGIWLLGGICTAAAHLGIYDDNVALALLTVPIWVAWTISPILLAGVVMLSSPRSRLGTGLALAGSVLISPAGDSTLTALLYAGSPADQAPWSGMPAAAGLALVATAMIRLSLPPRPGTSLRASHAPHQIS